jgi:chromosome segregation ATPase
MFLSLNQSFQLPFQRFWLPFLITGVLLTFSFSLSAQEVEPLLQEREQLMREYEQVKNQRSNILGKQSKKDLVKVIESLKEIIRNDTRLITAYKTHFIKQTGSISAQNSKLSTQVENDRTIMTDRYLDLHEQISSLTNQLKARERKLKSLQAERSELEKEANGNEHLVFLLGVLLSISVILNLWLFLRKKAR